MLWQKTRIMSPDYLCPRIISNPVLKEIIKYCVPGTPPEHQCPEHPRNTQMENGMKDRVAWLAISVLSFLLVFYIIYLRRKKAIDTATSRFAKWGTIGVLAFFVLFFGLLFYLFAFTEPDFFTAWKKRPFHVTMSCLVAVCCLITAIVLAVRRDRPRMRGDAKVDMPAIAHSKWKGVITCAIAAFWFGTIFYTLVQRKPDFASAWNDYKAMLVISAVCFLVFLVTTVILTVSGHLK